MRILQNWTPWTGPAEHFSRSGAKNLKSMSPKIHPVKTFSGKDARQRGFRTEDQGQALRGWRFKVRGKRCATEGWRLEEGRGKMDEKLMRSVVPHPSEAVFLLPSVSPQTSNCRSEGFRIPAERRTEVRG